MEARPIVMRGPVKSLVENPDLVLTDSASAETIEWAQQHIESFEHPAQDDEAVGLLNILARSDETSCFGLNEAILHFIETAPGWPIWTALQNAQGEWPERLRTRLRNAGRYPPNIDL